MGETSCYLDNQELEMITESDHLNGFCLCEKCSCGLHRCARPVEKRSPRSIYRSSYDMSFKRHTTPQRKPRLMPESNRSLFKLDSITTQKHDFQAYQYAQQPTIPMTSRDNLKTSHCALSSTSTYKQEFTNRGCIRIENFKNHRLNTAVGLKFTGLSTYMSNFQIIPQVHTQVIKPVVNTNILCGVKDMKTPVSSMKASFKQGKGSAAQIMGKAESNFALPAVVGQYNTSNSVNYGVKNIGCRIRRVRRSVE